MIYSALVSTFLEFSWDTLKWVVGTTITEQGHERPPEHARIYSIALSMDWSSRSTLSCSKQNLADQVVCTQIDVHSQGGEGLGSKMRLEESRPGGRVCAGLFERPAPGLEIGSWTSVPPETKERVSDLTKRS
jgi:hypothetical protein